jgi:hypothetical protein
MLNRFLALLLAALLIRFRKEKRLNRALFVEKDESDSRLFSRLCSRFASIIRREAKKAGESGPVLQPSSMVEESMLREVRDRVWNNETKPHREEH